MTTPLVRERDRGGCSSGRPGEHEGEGQEEDGRSPGGEERRSAELLQLDGSADAAVRSCLQQEIKMGEESVRVSDLLGTSPQGSDRGSGSYRTVPSDQGADRSLGLDSLDYASWDFDKEVEESFFKWAVEDVKSGRQKGVTFGEEELILVERGVSPVSCPEGGLLHCPLLAATAEASVGYLAEGIYNLKKSNEAALGTDPGLDALQPQRTCDITRNKFMDTPLQWMATARVGGMDSKLPSGLPVYLLLGSQTLNICVFRWLLLAEAQRIPTRWPSVVERFYRDWRALLLRGVCRTNWDTG